MAMNAGVREESCTIVLEVDLTLGLTIPIEASDIDDSPDGHFLFEGKSVVEIEYRSTGASKDDVVAVGSGILHFPERRFPRVNK